MKTISENLYERGVNGIKYCRRRIPVALAAAYPKEKTHVVRSLGTSDLRLAKQRFKAEINRIDAEFAKRLAVLQEKQAQDEAVYSLKKVDTLSEELVTALAGYWVRQVLLTDERVRSGEFTKDREHADGLDDREFDSGLSDNEFDELGDKLEAQRVELGRMLATGRSDKILPAMHGFFHLCGLGVEISPKESKQAGAWFLSAVVTALDHQRARHSGQVVKTNDVAPVAPVAPTPQ